MTEIKITNILIGLLVISTIVIGYLAFFTDLATNYGVTADTEAFESTYDKITILNNELDAAENKTRSISADNDAQFFTGFWPAIKLIMSLIGSILDIGSDIIIGVLSSTTGLNVPQYVPALMLGIFFVLVLGAIITLIRGRSI